MPSDLDVVQEVSAIHKQPVEEEPAEADAQLFQKVDHATAFTKELEEVAKRLSASAIESDVKQ